MDSYEKKYKEALERMKSWARGEHPECFTEAQKAAEFIFPELKENEDERIRKWLEEHIEAMPDNSIEFKDAKRIDVLHWLENQGEQKLDGAFVNVDDVREDFVNEVYRVLDADPNNDRANQIIDAFDNLPTLELEKQGEQKPTDKVEPKFKVKYAGSEYNVLEVKDIAGVIFYGIEDEPNHIDYIKAENCERVEDEIEIPYGAKDSELIEATYYIPKGFHAEIDGDKVVFKKDEKPTKWSEKYIADVFEKVGLAKIVREQSNDALTIALQDAMIELSKVTLQPNPTAWSEEDEAITLQIEQIMKCASFLNIVPEKLNKINKWLKSLKQRIKE